MKTENNKDNKNNDNNKNNKMKQTTTSSSIALNVAIADTLLLFTIIN